MNAFRRDLPNPLLRREYVLDFCVIMRDSRRNDFNLTMSAGVVAHGEGNGNPPPQSSGPIPTRYAHRCELGSTSMAGSGAIRKRIARFGGLGIIIAEWGSGVLRVKVRCPGVIINYEIDSLG